MITVTQVSKVILHIQNTVYHTHVLLGALHISAYSRISAGPLPVLTTVFYMYVSSMPSRHLWLLNTPLARAKGWDEIHDIMLLFIVEHDSCLTMLIVFVQKYFPTSRLSHGNVLREPTVQDGLS